MAGTVVQPRTSTWSGGTGLPRRTSPPPRPAVTSDLAPPSLRERPTASKAVRLSAGLWFASCAAGMFGVAAALLDGTALQDRLTAAAQGQVSASVVADGVWVTITLVTCVPALLAVVTFIGGALVVRGRAAGRWLLLVTAPLGVIAALVAQSVVAGGVDLDRVGLLAQAGLLGLGLLSLFSRPVRSWLRSTRS